MVLLIINLDMVSEGVAKILVSKFRGFCLRFIEYRISFRILVVNMEIIFGVFGHLEVRILVIGGLISI